jgi:peptidoglycan/LPS O-acetylase OafA/YrhL
MQLKFLQRFKRITYSTSYLPEVDGLRFLAIFSVVVIMHIPHYLDEKFYGNQLVPQGYWKNFIIAGGHGVGLFFVISGFILSLPFAKWRLNKEKKVSLKRYYLRRLTRLEPPYIIALIIFFIANVWVLQKYSFENLLPHFFVSATYLHTIIYHSFSSILPVAWSLEVEVQFYVLAPLFFLIFAIPSNLVRRVIFLLVIVAGSYYWFDYWRISNVFTFLNVFFIGLLLADLYCTDTILIKGKVSGLTIGIISLAGFLFIPSIYSDAGGLHFGIGYLVKLVCMFFLFQSVLNNTYMKKLFSAEIIIIIGGMCYSIYLLHFAIISAAGSILLKANISVTSKLYFPLFAIALIVLVLLISSVFFLLIEKPFMRPVRFLKKGPK